MLPRKGTGVLGSKLVRAAERSFREVPSDKVTAIATDDEQ